MILNHPKEDIKPGEVVFFMFRYVGTQGTITLFVDIIRANGELIPNGENGFRSVAMMMDGQNLYAHIARNKFQGDGYFVGSITLQKDIWNPIALVYDKTGDYSIKISESDTTKSSSVYLQNWADFPNTYSFIR
jgi:hypothetical protein